MPPRSSAGEHGDLPLLDRAAALQAAAVQENGRGHPGRGARLIRQGLRLLEVDNGHQTGRCASGRCRLAARLWATLAKSVIEIEGVDQALTLMNLAQDWSGCLADPHHDAFLLSQRALILFRGGRLEEAESAFSAALALLEEGSTDAVRALINRGALYVELGALGRARDDLSRAARASRDLGDPQFEHIAVHNLGCLEFTAGDLPQALRLMEASRQLDAQTLEGLTHLDRARVLLAAGLPEEADAALVQAAELFRRDRCWQDLGEVDLTRAEVALLTDRIEDARRLAGRARDRFRRHGNDRWRRNAELVLLHADRAADRPAGRLLPPARRLAAEFAAAGLPVSSRTALLLAAELEQALGHAGSTAALLDQVGPTRPTDPISLRLHGRLVGATALAQRGDGTRARRILARGLEDLASYQAQFGGIDLQSASAVHGRRLAQQDLELALRTGRPAAVVAAVERSRAVSGRIRPVTPPPDELTAELLVELRQAVAAGAGQRVADLQAELRSRSWLTSGSRAWHPPVRASALRTAAREGGVHLVTVTELRGRVGAVTLPATGPARLVELADGAVVREGQRRLAADLDALATGGLAPSMAAAVLRSLQRTSAELSQLLAPAFPADHRPVVVSPAGTLLALPWPLLPVLRGRPVSVTPALSGWYRARARLLTARPGAAASWVLTAAAGPGLARAAQEAGGVVDLWAAQRVDARELLAATPTDLSAAMEVSRVVHVAAHGTHQSENPMFSALTLTGGPLFAYELDRRTRVPEHVVLSACDVGRSTVRAERETLGLTSVLLQLGCVGVVAGVARVHDEVAAALMVGYHRELARGRTAAEALLLGAEDLDQPSPFVSFGADWSA